MTFIIIMAVAILVSLIALFSVKRALKKWVLTGFAVFAVVFTLANSFTIVSPGDVKVPVILGSVQNNVLDSGFKYVNPVAELDNYNVKRRSLEFNGEHALETITSDRVKIIVEATATFRTNPAYTPIIREKLGIGHIDTVVIPAARTSFREASAAFTWTEAAITKRPEFAQSIQDRFQEAIKNDVISNGVDPKDAENMYIIGKVQLRKIILPERITDAVSERLAASEQLKKQETLRLIAEKEAERRKEEGDGIANLLNAALGNTPGTQYDPEAVRIVLGAISEKTKADAMAQAVEMGQVKVMVMDGNTPAAVSVK